MPQKKAFYKVTEVANIMNMSPRSVHKWIKLGRLKAQRTPSNTWIVSAAELQRFKRMGEIGRVKGIL